MPTCVATNCRNRTSLKKSGVTFHIIPKNERLREEWIKAISREENWVPSKYTYVCSDHFSEDLYDRTSLCNVRLKPNAVPNIFSNDPPLKPKKSRRKNDEISYCSSDSSSLRDSKRSRKLNPLPRRAERYSRAKYDGQGVEKETGRDLCDCLEENCPGCWMNCPNCSSTKCGHECRRYRRYKYESLEIEGTDITIKTQSRK